MWISNSFVEAFDREASKKLTENQAMAYSRTKSALLDLFGVIGSLRPRTEEEIIQKFEAAFKENQLYAVKMLFYAGDVRQGLGERRTFRVILKWLANHYPKIVAANLSNIPCFNRWDSMYALIDTPVEDQMWEYVSETLKLDFDAMREGKPVSLLAKWLKSENASSPDTKELARRTISALHHTPRTYRKLLSTLRGYIDVTERKMSAKEWQEINYSEVPSYAMKNYRAAFSRNDEARFDRYLEDLQAGKTKINASVLYPYDLVREARKIDEEDDPNSATVVNEMWKALPNYVEDGSNVLVVADVSGSMECDYGRPMNTSVGLAIYFAERNKGILAGKYMTFSETPRFLTIDPDTTIQEKVDRALCTGVGYNTNLEGVFDTLLQMCVDNDVPVEELPKAIVVVSDMEIDRYLWTGHALDFIQSMKERFQNAGYSLPQLVCWNVESRQDTFLSRDDDVLLVSGQSASVFKRLTEGFGKTAMELMFLTLDDPIYDRIQVDPH